MISVVLDMLLCDVDVVGVDAMNLRWYEVNAEAVGMNALVRITMQGIKNNAMRRISIF